VGIPFVPTYDDEIKIDVLSGPSLQLERCPLRPAEKKSADHLDEAQHSGSAVNCGCGNASAVEIDEPMAEALLHPVRMMANSRIPRLYTDLS
jgi:hypothetical protein